MSIYISSSISPDIYLLIRPSFNSSIQSLVACTLVLSLCWRFVSDGRQARKLYGRMKRGANEDWRRALTRREGQATVSWVVGGLPGLRCILSGSLSRDERRDTTRAAAGGGSSDLGGVLVLASGREFQANQPHCLSYLNYFNGNVSFLCAKPNRTFPPLFRSMRGYSSLPPSSPTTQDLQRRLEQEE